MTLRFTNTLTRRIEEFLPLNKDQVSIYCCGVTVYDLCHLGHARSYIVWDVLRRYLIWKGYKVDFVQNFTDIDDKILSRAAKEGSTMDEVSERNINAFHQDMGELGILRPDRMPRATKCLDGIRALILELESLGAAYSVDGDVYFSVMKHSGYGKLSGRTLGEQQINADGRVGKEEGARKQHEFDFALWKAAKEGEPSFPSPWGEGRPGWHIECSAMVREELGQTIDIHLGGADLIFPHHENEIAQSEAANRKELARYWLHNGMVNVDGQKMSKSLGNFTTIRNLLDSGVSPMTLRLFVLQAHYRKPLDFTDDALKAASNGWKGLNSALSLVKDYASILGWPEFNSSEEDAFEPSKDLPIGDIDNLRTRFIKSMDDDLNTSASLAVLFNLARPLRALSNKLSRDDNISSHEIKNTELFLRWKLLTSLSGVLGLRLENNNNSIDSFSETMIDEKRIEKAIIARKYAKTAGDFAKADKIRDELKVLGIELIDKPGGITQWFSS